MLPTLVICLTVVYLVERVLQFLRERAIVPVAPAPASEPMPADLRLWSKNWSDPWAREQARVALEESYARHQDWHRVRAEVMEANG